MKAVKRWVVQRKGDGKYYNGTGHGAKYGDITICLESFGDGVQEVSMWKSRDAVPVYRDERAVPVLVTIRPYPKKGGKP